MIHHSARCHHDPIPGQVYPPGKLQTIAERAQVRVKTVQAAKRFPVHQQSRRAHAQHVLAAVILTLVNLAGVHFLQAPPGTGSANADLHDLIGFVPQPLFRADDFDG